MNDYTVVWSDEDGEYVATCTEFPSLSWLAVAPVAALAGLVLLIEDIEAEKNRAPKQPYGPVAFCGTCGHFAARHGLDGCSGAKEPCECEVMQWAGYKWPRPWMPAPEGLRRE